MMPHCLYRWKCLPPRMSKANTLKVKSQEFKTSWSTSPAPMVCVLLVVTGSHILGALLNSALRNYCSVLQSSTPPDSFTALPYWPRNWLWKLIFCSTLYEEGVVSKTYGLHSNKSFLKAHALKTITRYSYLILKCWLMNMKMDFTAWGKTTQFEHRYKAERKQLIPPMLEAETKGSWRNLVERYPLSVSSFSHRILILCPHRLLRCPVKNMSVL